MFSIIWLRKGAEVGREMSDITRTEDVLRYARARALSGLVNAEGSAPEEFRVLDRSGFEIGRELVLHTGRLP